MNPLDVVLLIIFSTFVIFIDLILVTAFIMSFNNIADIETNMTRLCLFVLFTGLNVVYLIVFYVEVLI